MSESIKYVFVTGGAGYIGSVCTEELLNAGHQVTVYDSLVEGHRSAVDSRANFIHARPDEDGNILAAANALIRNNRARLGKNLWTSQAKGEPLRVYEAASDIDEASFIVDEVKSLAAEGVRLAEIALLYRSNAQSRVLDAPRQ